MYQSHTMASLAQTIGEQRPRKVDHLLDQRLLTMTDDLQMMIGDHPDQGGHRLSITPHAHTQLSDKLGVPMRYYRRMMQDAPQLLRQNVNHWLQSASTTRLVRTLDHSPDTQQSTTGLMRALLSDRYRVLDNYWFADAILQATMGDMSSCDVCSCDVNMDRMLIKITSHELEGEVRVGEVVRGGIIAGNGETGGNTSFVQAFFETLQCTNGMVYNTEFAGLRRVHLGPVLQLEGHARQLVSDDTLSQSDAAFFSAVRDVARNVFDRKAFDRAIASFREAQDRTIDGDIPEAVRTFAQRHGLGERESSSVLDHLIRDGNLTQWGLASAVTRAAQDSDSYDRATELEGLGGAVIDLTPAEWRLVAQAEAQ